MIPCWKTLVLAIAALICFGASFAPVSARSGTPVESDAADAELLDSPVGHQFDWIMAILGPDAALLTEAEISDRFTPAFLETRPATDFLATTNRFIEAYGPVTLIGLVRQPTERQLVGLLATPSGDELVIVVGVEHTAPHRISLLTFYPATAGIRELVASGGAYGGLYDIGGRELYLSCTGPAFSSNGPTVIFEAGHGNDSTVWLGVQATLEPGIRACAYDRANAPDGTSDLAPTPRDGNDVVADLHALLQTAGVPGPYVMVGHSLGGPLVRLYASSYPEEVAGMVLVDSSHEDQQIRLEALVNPELWAQYQELGDGFVDPEGFDITAIFDQTRVARTASPLLPMPLIVLTHGVAPDASIMPTGWPIEADEQLWRSLHEDLATLVPNAQLIVAEQSRHYIQLDQSELVVNAIQDVIAVL